MLIKFKHINKNYLVLENKKFGHTDQDAGIPNKKFDTLSIEDQDFIDAIINTKSESIKNSYWFINKLKSNHNYRLSLLYYAIERDALDFVKFIIQWIYFYGSFVIRICSAFYILL